MRIAVVHGPNLNLLGVREPEVYGTATLGDVNRALAGLADELGAVVEPFQSNSQGAILDFLAEARDRVEGVVVNPAGLGHTSVALLDGLLATGKPFVEVHLSNPASRERFRRHSYLTSAAVGVVAGFGMDSYLAALRCLVNHLRRQQDADPGGSPPGRR
ncbi:MAG: 3-dehydroquinate dehydratase [Gemmatimonadetes bacterium]|nr:3-dehydroquinate dehydratase [Gemmatimonadota bacterium]